MEGLGGVGGGSVQWDCCHKVQRFDKNGMEAQVAPGQDMGDVFLIKHHFLPAATMMETHFCSCLEILIIIYFYSHAAQLQSIFIWKAH